MTLEKYIFERNQRHKRERAAYERSLEIGLADYNFVDHWNGRRHPTGARSIEAMIANLPACLSDADRAELRARYQATAAKVAAWSDRPMQPLQFGKGFV
jgi:ribulose kinase